MKYHIAQVNIGRIRASLDDPVMAGFVGRHVELLRQRHDWFETFLGALLALWWVPVRHTQCIDEAKKRLAHLDRHGLTQFAFNFKAVSQPDDWFQQRIDWGSFQPCPAVEST